MVGKKISVHSLLVQDHYFNKVLQMLIAISWSNIAELVLAALQDQA